MTEFEVKLRRLTQVTMKSGGLSFFDSILRNWVSRQICSTEKKPSEFSQFSDSKSGIIIITQQGGCLKWVDMFKNNENKCVCSYNIDIFPIKKKSQIFFEIAQAMPDFAQD